MWTESRKKTFIISALRSAWRRYPIKWEVVKDASVGKKVNGKTKRVAEHFICNECKQEFTSKDIQVDHISPIVNVDTGWVSWDNYIERMFCEKDNLQVLCKPCHLKKSNEERKARKK